MILAGPEIVEELVDDEKNAIVRMNLGERVIISSKAALLLMTLLAGGKV